jgi:ABC-type multidrug transport system ATPase subunit
LLRILGRREPADSGDGILLGRPLGDDLAAHGHEVAFVSEATDYAVPGTMRAFFSRYSDMQPGWGWALFESSMSALNVDLDKSFGALSRGQKMQVACAVALAAKPRLFLLDEVTSVLDARARPYFVGALSALCRAGSTVLMATNIVSEVRDAADRLLLIEGGSVQINVSVAELSERFLRLVRRDGEGHSVFAAHRAVPVRGGRKCALAHPAR